MTLAKKHECPYGGRSGPADHWWECGQFGTLCDRCKEDRADARNKQLVEAIERIRPVWTGGPR